MNVLVVEVHGKRFNIRGKPMEPLSDVVAQALAQAKVDRSPSECKLMHNQKALDLTTPLRFANLPSGAKLQVVTGCEKRLGVQTVLGQTSTVPRSAAVEDKPISGHAVVPPEPGSSSTVPPPEGQQPLPQHQPQIAAVQSGNHTADDQPVASSGHAMEPSRTSEPPAVTQGPAGGGANESTVHDDGVPPDDNTPERSIYVFTQQELNEHLAASGPVEEEPEDFFEFTEHDAHVVLAAYARQRASAEKGLETRAMREQQEQQRATRFASAVLRIHLPDGWICQNTFSPLDPLSTVEHFLRSILDPSVGPFHLYTTPPKTVLKNSSETLYHLGLVPAANVHLAVEGVPQGAPLLGQAVREKYHGLPESYVASQRGKEAAGKLRGDRSGNGRAAGGGSSSGQGKKVPKWLKLK